MIDCRCWALSWHHAQVVTTVATAQLVLVATAAQLVATTTMAQLVATAIVGRREIEIQGMF